MSDFLLAGAVDHEVLRLALESVLGAEVEVIEDIEEILRVTAPITAQVLATRGEFRTHVALHLDRDVGRAEIRAISAVLQTAALADDGSVNPFTWYLIRPDGSEDHVGLDPDALERDEYRIGID